MSLLNLEKRRMKIDNTDFREFSYSKGDVTLKFTLRTDIKGQLKDFLECLREAEKELEKEINL